jgi:hypothetical protein
VVRAAVLLLDAPAAQFALEAIAAALPPDSRVVNTIPLPVRVDAGAPCSRTAARKAASTMAPVTRCQAVIDRAYREWSSSQVKISVPVPSVSG